MRYITIRMGSLESADYAAYKEKNEASLPKYKFYSELKKDFDEKLIPEARPYIS